MPKMTNPLIRCRKGTLGRLPRHAVYRPRKQEPHHYPLNVIGSATPWVLQFSTSNECFETATPTSCSIRPKIRHADTASIYVGTAPSAAANSGRTATSWARESYNCSVQIGTVRLHAGQGTRVLKIRGAVRRS